MRWSHVLELQSCAAFCCYANSMSDLSLSAHLQDSLMHRLIYLLHAALNNCKGWTLLNVKHTVSVTGDPARKASNKCGS